MADLRAEPAFLRFIGQRWALRTHAPRYSVFILTLLEHTTSRSFTSRSRPATDFLDTQFTTVVSAFHCTTLSLYFFTFISLSLALKDDGCHAFFEGKDCNEGNLNIIIVFERMKEENLSSVNKCEDENYIYLYISAYRTENCGISKKKVDRDC